MPTPDNPKADKIGVLKEVDLAAKVGLPQKKFRDFRKLSLEPSDWFHEGVGRFKRVWWCDSGLQKIEQQLGIQVSRVVPMGETMEVVKANFFNKRVIQCKRANGEVVIVRVRDSKNFAPRKFNGQPMQIRAKRDGGGWAVEGNGPRRKGVI